MADVSDCRWWQKHGSEATARSITAALAVLDKFHDGRKAYLATAARLYGNLPPTSMFSGAIDASSGGFGVGTTGIQLRRNITQSCVDTVQARVASRINPMVMWLSSGGTYKSRRRAKKLTRFTEGLFREQKTRTLTPRMFKDAEIFGSGYIAVEIEHGRVKFSRILENELRWDEVEARYAPPRQLHRVRPVDRDVLLALFPSKSAIINRAQSEEEKSSEVSRRSLAPLVVVRESWRLPDGPGSKGRHVISIPDGCLVDEAWEHDFFPIVKFDYNDRPVGWTGQGLVEILCDHQVALNRALGAISTSQYLMGSWKIGLEEGSRVNPNHLTNAHGSVFWYRRTASGGGLPVYLTPPIVQPEVYQEAERIEQKMYQLSGVSMMTASGVKAPGVNAAVAMRQMVDIENDRFATVSAKYEQAHVELGRIAIEMISDLVKAGGKEGYSVQDLSSRRQPVLDFKDIDFKRDEFTIQAFPVASLPNDPEGRLQRVQEYIAAGWLDPRQGRMLLSFPDVQSWENLQDAATEWIQCSIDSIVDEHEYIAPDADEDDLATALELVTQEISLAKVGGLEDEDAEAMKLLRMWKSEVERLLNDQQAQANAQQAQAPAAEPLAKPAPLPVSQLLPMAQQPQNPAM